MPYAQSTIAHRHDLADRLDASAVRIANYERRLLVDTATMRPIYLERLLDDYRAELIRYDRLDRELTTLEESKKTNKQQHLQKLHREKIKY